MAGFRKPGRRDFERTGKSDIPNWIDEPTQEDGMKLPDMKTSREGPRKVGKTTLASQWAPDTTLLLDTHKGTELLEGEHYIAPIKSLADFESAVDQIAAGGHHYRTIVVDLIEDIWKFAKRAAADRYGKLSAASVEYGKGTDEAVETFRRAVSKLLATDCGVWFLSHTEQIQDGNVVQYAPKLDKRIIDDVDGACDFVLLADVRGPNRQLHTAPSARFQAGTRTPLPDPMPLDARALYVEIAKGLARPKPQQIEKTSEPEKVAA
jgi:hypothetical protein